jgi:hypothetical protein
MKAEASKAQPSSKAKKAPRMEWAPVGFTTRNSDPAINAKPTTPRPMRLPVVRGPESLE